jgi:hypothetical protein
VGQPCIFRNFTPGGLWNVEVCVMMWGSCSNQRQDVCALPVVGLYCSTTAPHASQLALPRTCGLSGL